MLLYIKKKRNTHRTDYMRLASSIPLDENYHGEFVNWNA